MSDKYIVRGATVEVEVTTTGENMSEYPRAVGNWIPGPSVEEQLEKCWAPPTIAERLFLIQIREARANGVGYGWMQQVIEWEWNHLHPGAWGPEYYEGEIKRLEARNK